MQNKIHSLASFILLQRFLRDSCFCTTNVSEAYGAHAQYPNEANACVNVKLFCSFLLCFETKVFGVLGSQGEVCKTLDCCDLSIGDQLSYVCFVSAVVASLIANRSS